MNAEYKEIDNDFERARAEESIAKNEANQKIVELSTEGAYEEQELKDKQNLLLIDYVYNNSKEYNANYFDVKIGNETVQATVDGGKVSAMIQGHLVEIAIPEKLIETKIDLETRDYLAKHYTNTMFKYGNMYYLLQKSLGEPVRIKFKDLKTGKKVALYHENGEPVSSSLRCVTPSTSVEIEYTDKYGKSLYLTLPGMKNVERAIEKVKIGGKYDTAYKEDAKKIRIKYAFMEADFIPEIKEFIEKQAKTPIGKEIHELDERYVNAITYYLSELKKMKFADKDKKQELIYKKRIHEIEMSVKQGKANIVDVVKEVYDMAINAAYYDKSMENHFNEKSLLSRYLSELEEVFTSNSGAKKKSNNSSYQYKELLQVYYKSLGGNPQYAKELAAIRKPYERLNDIFRCSVITRYYDNITNIKQSLDDGLKAIFKNDKFFGNSNPYHEGFKESRGYRDDKVVYEKRNKDDSFNIAFETQFKIATLGEKDYPTHKIYEEIRGLEEVLRDCYDPSKINVLKTQIAVKKLEIRNVYGDGLKNYNDKVLETAAEMEIELFRKEWKERLNIPKDLETFRKLNSDRALAEYDLRRGKKTMPEVEKFIRDNLLVSPFMALNIKDDISNIKHKDYSEKTKKIEGNLFENSMIVKDEVETKADMRSFARRYYNVIKKAYICTIDGEAKLGFFDDYEKALVEKVKQVENIKTIRGGSYLKSLSEIDRKKINREEHEYLEYTGKEKVAPISKKIDNSKKSSDMSVRCIREKNSRGK